MNTDVRKLSILRLLVFFPLMLLLFAFPEAPARGQAGTFTKLETSFDVPGMLGNPFDYTRNDVRVSFTGLDGKLVLSLPAGQADTAAFLVRSR